MFQFIDSYMCISPHVAPLNLLTLISTPQNGKVHVLQHSGIISKSCEEDNVEGERSIFVYDEASTGSIARSIEEDMCAEGLNV
jgi:hypothetical protein